MATRAGLSRRSTPDPLYPTESATRGSVENAGHFLAPVASRSTVIMGTDGTSGTGTAVQTYARTGRTVHRVIGGASAITLEYLNWYTQPNSPGEVDNPNSVTLRASVEYPAGKPRQISGSTAWNSGTTYAALDQVTYSGSSYVALTTTTPATAPTSALGTEWQLVTRYTVNFTGQDVNRIVTVAAGASVQSLPVSMSVVDGQYMAVTTTVSTGLSTNYFSGDYVGTGSMDFAQNYASSAPTVGTVDMVDIGVTTQTNMSTGSRIPSPSAIWGNTRDPSYVALVGDSLVMGYLDTEVDSDKQGLAVRGMQYEDRLYRKVSQGGDRMMYWTATNAAKRLALVENATAVFCDLGSNDIANSRTLAQLQADAQTAWTQMGRSGARVYQMTILPKTTSTDSWATKGNQTPVAPAFASGGVKDTYNTWLRAGASLTINGKALVAGQSGHPLTGLVDISSAVEDTTDTHYWKSPSWTTDGGHPTAAGYDALAVLMRQYIATMVRGPLKHAHTHATGGSDALTSADIGAADLATLGGYLPTFTGQGGLSDYIIRGGLAENIPYFCATGTYTMVSGSRTMVLLLSYNGGYTYTGVRMFVSTAMSGGVASLALYAGTNIAALARVDSNRTPTFTAGYNSIAFSTPQALTASGYLAVEIVLTTAPTTYPAFAATPTFTASGIISPPSGATVAGVANLTAAPGATLNVTTGWTSLTQIPWGSMY